MKKSEKKLLIVLACVLIVTFYTLWNSQIMNLKRIQKHISEIAPVWHEFQQNNPGFEQVTFYSFTGGNGMFSAVGEVITVADRDKLKEFMESTDPPRPVHLRGLRVRELGERIQAEYETLKEAEQDVHGNTH